MRLDVILGREKHIEQKEIMFDNLKKLRYPHARELLYL